MERRSSEEGVSEAYDSVKNTMSLYGEYGILENVDASFPLLLSNYR